MNDDKKIRLINAYELEKITAERCGLSAVKFIELIRDCPTATGEQNNDRTHNTRTENEASSTP